MNPILEANGIQHLSRAFVGPKIAEKKSTFGFLKKLNKATLKHM